MNLPALLPATEPSPLRRAGLIVGDGPRRVGSELRWRLRQADGTTVVLAQLLPELARDVSLRRRWVGDVRRVAALAATCIARTLEIGPDPDPTDCDAEPPWRIREDPEGETLEELLARRAPLPPDEAAELVARIAEALHEVHTEGAVLRDVGPRRIVLGAAGIRLVDIGLSRVDVLSTRTAASLILEGSAYASPEQIERTTVDARSDVYGLGVVLFRALTGAQPYGDAPAILRPTAPAPRPSRIRPGLAPLGVLDDLVDRCLRLDPAERPDTAADVAAILRGERTLASLDLASVACQGCGAQLPAAQRLCLRCGKLAVRFEHRPRNAEGPSHEVVLNGVDEQADTIAALRDRLGALARGPLPALNFLVGDQRMYSKRERERLIRLPVALFSDLDERTANALRHRLAGPGLKLALRDQTSAPPGRRRVVQAVIAAGAVALFTGMIVAGAPALALFLTALVVAVGLVAAHFSERRKAIPPPMPLLRLRPAAAALPASDPLVASLAALLSDDTPQDVRDHVGRLALAIQRLVDHRAENLGEAGQIDAVTEPVAGLVELVAASVRRLHAIDKDLRSLDEGALVRALAAAQARRGTGDTATPATEDTAEVLARLDRLRVLEDARARAFHRLLEASSLIHRAIELGLSVKDERAEHDRQIRLALLALSSGD